MRIGTIIGRVRTQCPGFAAVTHALTSPAKLPRPAALIAPVMLQAAEPGLLGLHSQMLQMRFGIYLMLERAQDGTADFGSADMFDDLTAELRAALVSWTPDPEIYSPVAYAGGKLEPYDAGIVVWRDDYTTTFEIRITP